MSFNGHAGTRLFVGNLAWKITVDDLRKAFGGFGPLRDVVVVMDRETQRSRGFGFVEFESAEDARRAVSAMNGEELGGRALKVNVAEKKREDRRDRGDRY